MLLTRWQRYIRFACHMDFSLDTSTGCHDKDVLDFHQCSMPFSSISLRNLPLNRLDDEATAESVSPSEGGSTKQDDDDKGDGDDDELDPAEGNGGHVLAAVDEARVAAVLSTTKSIGQSGGTGEPEEPPGSEVSKCFPETRPNEQLT